MIKLYIYQLIALAHLTIRTQGT